MQASAVWRNGSWWLDAEDRDGRIPLDVPPDATLGDAARAIEALGYSDVSIVSEPN